MGPKAGVSHLRIKQRAYQIRVQEPDLMFIKSSTTLIFSDNWVVVGGTSEAWYPWVLHDPKPGLPASLKAQTFK